MVVLWVAVLVACVVGTSMASRRAVTSALRVADAASISPAVVGLTVMAIGTDLPEMANSLVSTASGHGDINVGDSMGSVVTQITLTLGILCFAGGLVSVNRNFVLAIGTATFLASLMVRVLVGDGALTRLDGAILILAWAGGTALLGHGELRPREVFTNGGRALFGDVLATLFWLGVIGALAVGVVESFLALAAILGIPEFIGSFVVLSIGTSLPELVVDWTAIRRGAASMAVGDVFGSSFVDATLSIGIGPAIFSSAVSSAVLPGVTLAVIGVLLATVAVTRARRYDWRLAVPLLAIYLGVQIGSVAWAV